MPRTRQPIRKGLKRQNVLSFARYMNGRLHTIDTNEAYDMTPQQFQKWLHQKAEWCREKFEMRCHVNSQIEGNYILFTVIIDGD